MLRTGDKTPIKATAAVRCRPELEGIYFPPHQRACVCALRELDSNSDNKMKVLLAAIRTSFFFLFSLSLFIDYFIYYYYSLFARFVNGNKQVNKQTISSSPLEFLLLLFFGKTVILGGHRSNIFHLSPRLFINY